MVVHVRGGLRNGKYEMSGAMDSGMGSDTGGL